MPLALKPVRKIDSARERTFARIRLGYRNWATPQCNRHSGSPAAIQTRTAQAPSKVHTY